MAGCGWWKWPSGMMSSCACTESAAADSLQLVVLLYKISNDNRGRTVHFATSKYLTVKGTMFPHGKIHKYT
jgi:hypothetical protein